MRTFSPAKLKSMIKVFTPLYILLLISTSTKAQPDSMQHVINASAIAYNQPDPNYKLYPTQNMWTFLKLDTRSGQIWQVQYNTKADARFETWLNFISLVNPEDEVAGRFELFPTQNMWNFILLDQIDGKVWQVQWSQDYENRQIMSIE